LYQKTALSTQHLNIEGPGKNVNELSPTSAKVPVINSEYPKYRSKTVPEECATCVKYDYSFGT